MGLWEENRRNLGSLVGECLSRQGAQDTGLPGNGRESMRTRGGCSEGSRWDIEARVSKPGADLGSGQWRKRAEP